MWGKFKEEKLMSMKIINLTPHSITFLDKDGNVLIHVDPSGSLARVSVSKEHVDTYGGIPVKKSVFGEVEGLPDPQENTIYIVSSLVAQRCRGRDDVFIPDDSVRDEGGRIIGCRSLGRV